MTWSTLAPLPVARRGLAGATDGSGRIYAMGGQTAAITTDRVDRFDPATGGWTEVAFLPQARYGLAGAADSSGRIYAMGGHTGGPLSAQVDRFDPATGVWTTLAPLPQARYGIAGATDASGRIYAMGGATLAPAYLDRVDRFDPATGVWTTLGATGSLPLVLYAPAGAASSGRIYAMGGHTEVQGGGRAPTDRASRFDPATGKWTALALLSLARWELAGATDGDGRVYAVGGYLGSAGSTDRVERFDPATGVWTTLAPLSLARYGLAGAADSSGRIYAMGGHTGGAYSDRVERFDPNPVLGGWRVGSINL